MRIQRLYNFQNSTCSTLKYVMGIWFVFCSLNVFSANRYLVSGGNGNWNSSGNWSTTSGGSSGASYPVAGDVVIIDGNSGNASLSVNVSSACASLTIDSNYSGTFSLDANLTTTSTVTLGKNVSITGAYTWVMNNTCTITTSGKSFPSLTLGGTSQTFTLADTLRVAGTLALNGTTTTTFGGNAIICGNLSFSTAKTVTLAGNITSQNGTTLNASTTLNSGTLYTSGLSLSGGGLSGTTLLRLTGGTLSGSNVITSTSLTFDGNVTVSGSVAYNSGTINYISGTIVTTNSTLTCASNTTFNCAGMNWNDVVFSGTSKTHTLSADLNSLGTITFSGATATTLNGAYNVNCSNLLFSTAQTIAFTGAFNVTNLTSVTAAVTLNGATNLSTAGLLHNAVLSGTYSKITFNAKGTWSGSATLSKSVDINTTDTLTLSGTVNYNTGTLKYIAGTVNAGSSTVNCIAATTFNTSGFSFNNLTLSGTSQTHTLQSPLNVAGTLTITGTTATTFSGTYPITAGNLYFGAAATVTIPNTLTVTGLTTVPLATTLNGSFTLNTGGLSSGAALTGSFTDIVFNSTGTWSGSTTVTKNVTVNTTGTLTISGTVGSSGNLTYTAGTIITAGSTLSKSGNFNPGTSTWANLNVTGSLTLQSDCNLSGSLTVTSGALNGAYTYYVSGGFTHSAAAALTGVSSIVMMGKGTVAVTNAAGSISVPFIINTTDTITFGTNFRINNCAFTFTAGKIVSTGSTFETSGTASTITINGAGFKMGTYLSSISQSFGGTEGFSIGTFSCPTAGRTFTFASGESYDILNEISIVGTAASHCILKSSTPGARAVLTLSQSASEDLGFCDGTDLDSSAGKTIVTYKGIISNSLNWNLIAVTPKVASYTFN